MEAEKYADEFGPELIYEVYDPKTGLKAVTVVDNTALGPGKGGIRMTPGVNVEEVFRLARTMTWKNSLAELPFGGAKSGIIADVKNITPEKKKELIQSFSRALRPICPKLYIAGPDVNTAETEMKWFVEANGNHNAATGKPATMCVKPGVKCGIPHEYGSTGYGVSIATQIAIQHMGMDVSGSGIAIEGFGNVGTFVAKHMEEAGAKIVAVSDSKGCVYNPNGMKADVLIGIKEKMGSVTNYKGKGTEILPNKKIFELPVDVLVPAALPDVITMENVGKVQAKIVVEGANIPMKEDMENILHRYGKLVVPDFLANAGGVISSYAEYRGKNPKDMFKMVKDRISRNTKLVLQKADEKKVKPRDAAMEIAVGRVKSAMEKKN
jgi:glutamate dehydrogenase/leucine dehydrogenase